MESSDALLRAAGLPSSSSLWQPDPIVKSGKPGRLLHNRTVTARLVAATLPFLSKPPPAPIRTATRPTPLEVRCDGEFWAGRRAVPAEIVDVFMFAWQLDLLEVRLFELEHVVDAFVIWEGLFGQRGIEKPLVLAANMHRFARFRDKISYVVQDDLDFRTMLSAQRADGKLGKVWAAELGRWRCTKRGGRVASHAQLVLAGGAPAGPGFGAFGCRRRRSRRTGSSLGKRKERPRGTPQTEPPL